MQISKDLESIENRIRNKDRKKAIEGKDTSKVKRMSLFSTQIEDKFNDIHFVNRNYLTKIANAKYKCPVISLYLNFGPQKNICDPKNFISYYNSFKIETLKKRSGYLKTLSHEEQQSVKKDLDEIGELLKKQLIVEGFQSIVIFKSNEELHTIIKLPLLNQDFFTIDASPYTSQLESLIQEQEEILITRLDKNETVFYLYNFGYCAEIHRIERTIKEEDVDKSRPAKSQRHKLNQQERYFDKVHEYIYKRFIKNTADYLIIIGHEKTTTKKFVNDLHPEAQARLLETKNFSPQDLKDKNKMIKIVKEALEKYEEEFEDSALEELKEARGQGRLIAGLEQVLTAENRGLVHTLFVNGTFSQKGYVCNQRHYISLTNSNCPFCDGKLNLTSNCVDDLIELGEQQNVNLVIFTRKPDLMKNFDNVAALIYS